MGRFLFADRATWYFGGDRDIDWVGTGEREAFAAFLRRSSFCVRDSGLNLLVWKALLGVLGAVGSTGFGCDAFDRFEGRMGFGSGGCALSLSVTASAAARSAARCACCDVDGASEDAFGGNEGFDEALGEVEVCKDGCSDWNRVAVEKRKCWRHATALGAASGRNRDIKGVMRGIGILDGQYNITTAN